MDKPVSRFPVPALENLPADIRQKIVDVQEKAGFVPNVFLTLAHRPDEFRAFFAYHDALLLRESGLSKGEKEMIIVATSGAKSPSSSAAESVHTFIAKASIAFCRGVMSALR